MSSCFPSLSSIRLKGLALFLLALTVPAASASAADEPDLIFRRSTVFKWVSPNDKLATYGLDDPEVEGVACHFTVPEKGGFKGWLGLAEEVSDISLACRQVGPIKFKNKMEQGDDMLVYMVYSDRLIEGSPKNSTSTVPVMPWGPSDANVQKCGEFFTQRRVCVHSVMSARLARLCKMRAGQPHECLRRGLKAATRLQRHFARRRGAAANRLLIPAVRP